MPRRSMKARVVTLFAVASLTGIDACRQQTEEPPAAGGTPAGDGDAVAPKDEPASPIEPPDAAASIETVDSGPPSELPTPTEPAVPPIPCVPAHVGSGVQPLIDDFELDDRDVLQVDGRSGYEYTYSDTPESVELSSVPGGAPGSTRALRFTGSSAIQYGTGLGLPMDARVQPECPYDASNYVGVGFWARSAQPTATINVLATVGALSCRDVDPITDCLQFYTAVVNIDSTWRRYELPWGAIRFVGEALRPALGDPATIRQLYDLNFKPDLGAFDFSIDDVEFLTADCGSGVCNPDRPCPSDCCGDQRCDAFEAGNGPPPGLASGVAYSAGLLYCALDCPIDRDGCPARDIGSAVPQTVSSNTALGLDDFAASCDPSSAAPPLGAPDSEYVFTAPQSGQYLFDVTADGYQPSVYVLGGSCAGAQIACSANTSGAVAGARAATSVALEQGQVVTVVVDGTSGARGPFQLDIRRLEGECPDQDLGSTLPVAVTGTTAGEANSIVASCGDASSPDYTYLWTAPAAGFYDFSLEGSSYDTVLALRDGGCAGPELGCNDNGLSFGSLQSRLAAALSAGQSVAISVDGRGASGAYALAIREIACPGAELGSTVPLTRSGSTLGASDFFTPSCGASGAPEVTLAWSAPVAGTYTFDTVGSSFDTVLSVLDGATCGGAPLGCSDDANGASQITLPLAAQQSVLLIVDGYASGASGDYTLHITAQ